MPENGLVRVLSTSFAPSSSLPSLFSTSFWFVLFFVVGLAILWRPRAGASLEKAFGWHK